MTTNNTKITLFDIPVMGEHPTPRSMSPFVWPVRLVLNYKKLPYTTEWVHVSQIESICKANDIPLAEGASIYTFPCIIDRTDPSNIIRMMDSDAIIDYLDKTYPERPVYSRDERAKEVKEHALAKVGRSVSLLATKRFIPIADAGMLAYYEKVALRRWGVPLKDAMEAIGPVGSASREKLWEQAREGFEGFGLRAGDKWLGGTNEPAYKDFVVLAWMMAFAVSMEEEWSIQVKGWSDGKWKRYWEAAEEYMTIV